MVTVTQFGYMNSIYGSYDPLEKSKILDLDRYCTDPKICLSLEPEDAVYFKLPEYSRNFDRYYRELVEKLRGEGLSYTEARYLALFDAVRKLCEEHGRYWSGLPYHVRLLCCVLSRLLDPRISGLTVAQSWTEHSPNFYRLALMTYGSMCAYRQDRENCIDEYVSDFLSRYQSLMFLFQLYDNVRVGRKFVECLIRYIADRFSILIKLNVDPRQYLTFTKLEKLAQGTAQQVQAFPGVSVTLEDMLLTQHLDVVTIGLPFGTYATPGLSYFLDFAKIIIEHSYRSLSEVLSNIQKVIPVNPLRFRKIEEILAYTNVVVGSIKSLLRADRLEVPNVNTLIVGLYDLRRVLYELEKEFEINLITVLSAHVEERERERRQQQQRSTSTGRLA